MDAEPIKADDDVQDWLAKEEFNLELEESMWPIE